MNSMSGSEEAVVPRAPAALVPQPSGHKAAGDGLRPARGLRRASWKTAGVIAAGVVGPAVLPACGNGHGGTSYCATVTRVPAELGTLAALNERVLHHLAEEPFAEESTPGEPALPH